jgi:hypothetical protein
MLMGLLCKSSSAGLSRSEIGEVLAQLSLPCGFFFRMTSMNALCSARQDPIVIGVGLRVFFEEGILPNFGIRFPCYLGALGLL